MKKLLFRKFIKDNLKVFVIIIFSIGSIVWIIQSVNFLDFITEDGHSFKIYFYYSVLNFPKIIQRILPFVFFITLFYQLIHYEKKNDYVKGYDTLFKVLEKVNNDMSFKYFILFGNNTKNFPTQKFKNLIFLNYGFIENDKISNIYCLADYLILTSRQETFSQLTAESLINKRPVITFKKTGQAELIKHKHNGYLANLNDIKDFIKGINFFYENNFKDSKSLNKLMISNFYQEKLHKLYE